MRRHYFVWALFLVGALACLLLLFRSQTLPFTAVSQLSTPTPTMEPIVPTTTPTPLVKMTATATAVLSPPSTILPSATAVPPSPTSTSTPESEETVSSFDLSRYGVTGGLAHAKIAHDQGMPFSNTLSWAVIPEPGVKGFDYYQMVRLDENGIRRTTWEQIAEAIAANPGAVWLVGNEQDVIWQDNVTPQQYAVHYHDVYTFIKERDPSAQVAIGGVSQPTKLRRDYLDIVLDTYETTYGEPLPLDIWNVHAFTLREEADSWGVGIPPGMEGAEGTLYEIEDHTDLDIIRQNLIDFRAWMSARGYDDYPLIITEYGILMPADFGYSPEIVAEFMFDTFELFENLRGENGYSADDNHLVQAWFWFTLFDDRLEYQAGNLFDPTRQQLTELGQMYVAYVNGR